MNYLILVSFIWAFSFGLIKGNLTGLNPYLISFIRMSISFIFFLPFFHWKKMMTNIIVKLFIIGMIQYGLMYCTYIYSFTFLQAHQVALFTISTPFYVVIINDIFSKKIHYHYFVYAILAILGTVIIVFNKIELSNIVVGFLLLQISNISFAYGQVAYKRLLANKKELRDINIYAIIYFGAVFLTFFFTLFSKGFVNIEISHKQIYTLLYLGILASGICFFLWNFGAKKVNSGTLAVMNNLKIPLAIFCSLIFFGEKTDLIKLFIGSGMILIAVILSNKQQHNFDKSQMK